MNEKTSSEPGLLTERGLTRRTIVRGSAWSVPVIAMAAATPLAAASGETPCIPAADAGDYAYSITVDAQRSGYTRDTSWPYEVYKVPAGTTIPVTTTFTYTGPEPLPAGTTIMLGVANNERTWSAGTTRISGDPTGALSSPVILGNANGWAASVTYTTQLPITAGTVITFTWWAYSGESRPGNPNYFATRVRLPNSCDGTALASSTASLGGTDRSTPAWYYLVYNG